MLKLTIICASLALLVLVEISSCSPLEENLNEAEKEETRELYTGNGEPEKEEAHALNTRNAESEKEESHELNTGNGELPLNSENPKEVPDLATEGKSNQPTDPQNGPPNSVFEKKENVNVANEVDIRELNIVEENSQPSSQTFNRNHPSVKPKYNREDESGHSDEESTEKSTEKPRPPQITKVSNRGQDRGNVPSISCPPNVRCAQAPQGYQCTAILKSAQVSSTTNALGHAGCCPIHTCVRANGSKFFHFGIEIEDNGGRPPALSSYSSSFKAVYRPRFSPSNSNGHFQSYHSGGFSSAFASQSQNPVPMTYPINRIFSARNEHLFPQAPSQARFGPRGLGYRSRDDSNANNNRVEKQDNIGSVSAAQPRPRVSGFFPRFEWPDASSQPRNRNNRFQARSPSVDLFSPGENSEHQSEGTAAAGSHSFPGVAEPSRGPLFEAWSRLKRKEEEVGRQASEADSSFYSSSDGVVRGVPNYGFMHD